MSNKLYVDSFKIDNYVFYLGVSKNGLVCFDSSPDFKFKNKFNLIINKSYTKAYVDNLIKYFNKETEQLNIKIDLMGTPFQKQVWNELIKIPYGETLSYSDVAIKIGDINKTRAVANAIGKNNILILVPCHRVIGKNNKLTGFSSGLDLKEYLLDLEGVTNYLK